MVLVLGILFGLLTVLSFGLGNVLSKVPSETIGAGRSLFVRGLISSITLLIILFFFLSDVVFSLFFILIAFGISIIGFIPIFSLYKGLEKGDVSIVSTIAQTSSIFAIVLAVIFYGETLGALQVVWIGLIFMGVSFISLDFKHLRKSTLFKASSGIHYAFIAAVFWGIVFFLFRIPVVVIGPFLTAFIIEFGIVIISGLRLRMVTEKRKAIGKRTWIHLVLAGVAIGLGTLFFNLGIQVSTVSLLSAFVGAVPAFASLYGIIVYKERFSTLQYFGIAMTVLGIILLSSGL